MVALLYLSTSLRLCILTNFPDFHQRLQKHFFSRVQEHFITTNKLFLYYLQHNLTIGWASSLHPSVLISKCLLHATDIIMHATSRTLYTVYKCVLLLKYTISRVQLFNSILFSTFLF